MARGTLKMAHEIFLLMLKVVNLARERFFVYLHPPPPPPTGQEMPQAWENWVIWDISGPPIFFDHFLARGQKFLRSTVLDHLS